MNLKTFLFAILFLCTLEGSVIVTINRPAEIIPPPPRYEDSPLTLITLRHIEAKGIGYKRGYSTLETFFTSFGESFVPFLDLRGHIFDNRKLAANAGIGMRLCIDSRIWGINAYYDFRRAHRHSYNQAALGIEALGEVWDLVANGYLPVGNTKSAYSSGERRQCSLGGANLETGIHIGDHFYIGVSPYYLRGNGETAWGGAARIAITLYDCIKIAGNASYDHLFKWIGQGELGMTVRAIA